MSGAHDAGLAMAGSAKLGSDASAGPLVARGAWYGVNEFWLLHCQRNAVVTGYMSLQPSRTFTSPFTWIARASLTAGQPGCASGGPQLSESTSELT